MSSESRCKNSVLLAIDQQARYAHHIAIKLMEADMRLLLFAAFIGLLVATSFFSPLSPVVTYAMADPG